MKNRQSHAFTYSNYNAHGKWYSCDIKYLKIKLKQNLYISISKVTSLKKFALLCLELITAHIDNLSAGLMKNILLGSNIIFWAESENVPYWIKGTKKKYINCSSEVRNWNSKISEF